MSLSELMHAVAIMLHVHALACFVYGAAVRPELEHICPSPYAPCVYSAAVSHAPGGVTEAIATFEANDKAIVSWLFFKVKKKPSWSFSQ